jgi:hypothetical protein
MYICVYVAMHVCVYVAIYGILKHHYQRLRAYSAEC